MSDSPHLLPHGPSYRQLNTWVASGYLRPGNAGKGTGYPLQWTSAEAQVAGAMGRLVRAGLTVKAAARVARGDCELARGITVTVTRTPAI
jgi:hypothetical protein